MALSGSRAKKRWKDSARQLNAGVQPPGLDVSRGEIVLCMFRSRRLRDRRIAR